MSYTTPTEQVITSPHLVDVIIKKIQTQLASLTWITKSFGRAYKHTRLVDSRTVTYPAIFQSWKSDYYDGFPNDNLTAYSFIYVNPEEIIEKGSKIHNIQRKISVIIFFDLEKIDNTLQYRFTELLKEDVLIKLGNVRGLEVNGTSDEVEDAFSDFSISEINPEFLKERYGALRIDCTVYYLNTKCTINTYTS